MGAECHVHGTDLLGDQFLGFSCPSCERDEARAKIEELTRERDQWREEAWRCYVESGADPDGETDGTRLNIGEAVYAVKELRRDEEAVGDEACALHSKLAAAEAQRDTLREGIESLSVECRQEAMTQRDDYAPTDNARTDAYARIGGRLRSLLSTPPDKEGD